MRCSIECNKTVNFVPTDSIARISGSTHRLLEADKSHDSDLTVFILKVNALRVECNITSGAYMNEQKLYTIHEIFPAVASGFKIIEVSKEIIYLPVSV